MQQGRVGVWAQNAHIQRQGCEASKVDSLKPRKYIQRSEDGGCQANTMDNHTTTRALRGERARKREMNVVLESQWNGATGVPRS